MSEVAAGGILRNVRHLVAVGVAASGLALAIAATGAPEEPTALSNTAKRLVIDIPDWLKFVVLLSLGLAALLVWGLLICAPRAQPQEEGRERYYEPPKLRISDYVFLTALALIPFALAAGVLWFSYAWDDGIVLLPGIAVPGPPEQITETALVDAPGVSAIFGTLAIVVSVSIFGFMLWLYSGGWLLRRAEDALLPVRTRLERAVFTSLDDVLRERDARRAIIKCYGHFEAALAATHLARAPWQTPMEFMRSALQRSRLPHSAVCELTQLFELARFSEHSLDERERDIAVSCLSAISEALQKQEVASGTNG